MLEEESENGLLQSLDVELDFGQANRVERELVQGVQAPYLVFTSAQEIALAPLLQFLKTLGYQLTNCSVSYYSAVAGLYVYCGNDPVSGAFTVPVYEIAASRVISTQLLLRCREVLPNEFGSTLSLPQGVLTSFKAMESPKSPALYRTKERKIGYIIDKVMDWRALYNGSMNSDGEEVKFTLEQAASEVSISKKSLDDYLLQLRIGKRFGFNFHEHRDDKVGVLRAYVKRFKSIETMLKKEGLRRGDLQELAREANAETGLCKRQKCCVPPVELLGKIEELLRSR